MITTQYLVRVHLKDSISWEKADRRLELCHFALHKVSTLSVESMAGNWCCAPYIEVVVATRPVAKKVERMILKIVGRWVE